MDRSSTILVSPIFDPWYYEFYYKGLIDFYGRRNVKFDYSNSFISFEKYQDTKFRKDFFYYEIIKNGVVKKVSISAEDWTNINEEIYEKVDCYAKVNVEKNQVLSPNKLFPIGPNFGIRYFNLFEYLLFSLKLYIKSGLKNPYLKTYFKLSMKRSYYSSYEDYDKNASKNNFIFYLNYPWRKHGSVTNTRKQIIDVLRKMNRENKIVFEGGFSKRRFGFHEGLEDYSANKLYSHSKYLYAVKRSMIVINTPAVHDCLGWKLGEYLALNKTILSLPINRVMPGDFKPGKHYHEIKDIETEFEKELIYLLDHKEYRDELSKNVKEYYENYLSPKKVIERIHNNAFKC